jgi:hypothetical protein
MAMMPRGRLHRTECSKGCRKFRAGLPAAMILGTRGLTETVIGPALRVHAGEMTAPLRAHVPVENTRVKLADLFGGFVLHLSPSNSGEETWNIT